MRRPVPGPIDAILIFIAIRGFGEAFRHWIEEGEWKQAIPPGLLWRERLTGAPELTKICQAPPA